MAKILRALVAAAALAVLPALPVRAEPAMWTIRDKDSTIILFGSFHLLPDKLAWRSKALEAALGRADDVWFEIPLDAESTSAAQREVLKRAYLPPGQSLLKMLSPKGRERLRRVAMQVGAPLDVLDRMQPWYAETALGVAYYQKQGAGVDQGVEHQLDSAVPRTVPRHNFETAAQQLDMFGRGSRKEQLFSLEDTLRQFVEEPDYLPKVLRLWLAGDAKGLDKEVLGDMRRTAPADYQSLIVKRNEAWVPIIEKRLAGSGTTVMVVGVGHLVGKDGVPALLRRDGIRVDGP